MARKTTKPTTRKTRKPMDPSLRQREKPLFRSGTWIALLVFVLVAGAALLISRQAQQAAEAEQIPTAEPSLLFEGNRVANSIEVTPAGGETVRVERGGDNLWMLTLPFEIEADPGLVEAAASQINALSVISDVDADPEILGIEEPSYVITITFSDGSTGMLEVGDMTPTNSGYYVRVDGKRVVIIAPSGIDALANLADFPPYLNTPTPTATATPLPSETPVPPTEADSTPEATPTP